MHQRKQFQIINHYKYNRSYHPPKYIVLCLSQPAPGRRERDKAIVDSWREGREARKYFSFHLLLYIYISASSRPEGDKAIVGSLMEGREARQYFLFICFYRYTSQPAPVQREIKLQLTHCGREGKQGNFFFSFASIHIHLSQLPSRGR